MSLRKKTWISCINGVRIFNINHYTFSHLKRPFYRAKKIRKKRKINSRNFTYDGLTFSCSSFLLEQVKDEIWKHNGRSCFSIQECVNFIMFIEEFASLVLNTIFLFSQLTQLEILYFLPYLYNTPNHYYNHNTSYLCCIHLSLLYHIFYELIFSTL